MEKNWSLHTVQYREHTSKFPVQLFEWLAVLLRRNRLDRTQKAVMDDTSYIPPNSHHNFLWIKWRLQKVPWTSIAVLPLSWASSFIVENLFFITRYISIKKLVVIVAQGSCRSHLITTSFIFAQFLSDAFVERLYLPISFKWQIIFIDVISNSVPNVWTVVREFSCLKLSVGRCQHWKADHYVRHPHSSCNLCEIS